MIRKHSLYLLFLLCTSLLFTQQVTVTQPTGGEFHQGGNLNLIWTTSGISSGHVRIVLRKTDNSYRQVMMASHPYNASDIGVRIPSDAPLGQYRIRVKHLETQAKGDSPIFTLLREIPKSIQVYAPPSPPYSPGDRIVVRWDAVGFSSYGLSKVALRKEPNGPEYHLGYVDLHPGHGYERHIPRQITAGDYRIVMTHLETSVRGESPPFQIQSAAAEPVQALGYRINFKPLGITSPAAHQRYRLGTIAVIRWTMPRGAFDCGNKVSIYAIRKSNGDEYPITRNYHCQHGANSYNWNISTPFYGDRTGEYSVKIVTDKNCIEQSSTFRICTRDEYYRTSACDFAVDSAIFANGRSLNQGITVNQGSDIVDNFQVRVKWNKRPPSSPGNHTIQVKSVVTGETVSTANVPSTFSYRDAHAGTGIIRVNVPFTIKANRVFSMKRGRFIPLRFKLKLHPSACDSMPHNNSKELNLRVLAGAPPADFAVEIVPNSLRVERDKWNKGVVNFKVQIRVRNLTKTAAGGPPAPVSVQCSWANGPGPKGTHWGDDFTLNRVAGNWVYYFLRKGMYLPRNWWQEMTFTITVDKEKRFLDRNRNNNEASVKYTIPI